MAATYSRVLLSGSTQGKPIKISATAIASGTTIHTALSGTTGYDEVYLWITNTDSATHWITIGWGGTTDPDHLICKNVSIPAASGPIPLIGGIVLQNSLVIKAAADTTNVLLIAGQVNRIQ